MDNLDAVAAWAEMAASRATVGFVQADLDEVLPDIYECGSSIQSGFLPRCPVLPSHTNLVRVGCYLCSRPPA
jgi:hypothetical protein